jgi:hypothetical protein
VVRGPEDLLADKRLVAYVVREPEAAPAIDELRDFPTQWARVSSAFAFLDTLPPTPKGKVDHRLLPRPRKNLFARKATS